MPNQQSHKEAAVSFLQLVVAGKIREAYDQYISPNFRHHNPYFKGDRESLLVAMEEAETQFPGKVFKVQRVLEDGNLVAVHSSMQLKPEMQEIAVVHLFRFEGELIVEEWEVGQEVPENLPNENGMF
jgi:predicted SnoaL-like aldol condensation-catalyzing enzyme